MYGALLQARAAKEAAARCEAEHFRYQQQQEQKRMAANSRIPKVKRKKAAV